MQRKIIESLLRAVRFLWVQPACALGAGSLSVRYGEERVLIASMRGGLGCREKEGLILAELDGKAIFGMGDPLFEKELHLAVYKAVGAVRSVFFSRPMFTLKLMEAGISPRPVGKKASSWLGLLPVLSPQGLLDANLTGMLHILSYANLCLLFNQGIVTLGRTPREAVRLSRLVEEASKETLDRVRIDLAWYQELKEKKVGEAFFLSTFPWPLFGKVHCKYIEEKVALHQQDLLGVLKGLPPFEVEFCVDEVADSPKRKLEVGFSHGAVRILEGKKRCENKVKILGKFPVMEALFLGKATLTSALLHGRLKVAGMSLRPMFPFLKALEGFLRAVMA